MIIYPTVSFISRKLSKISSPTLRHSLHYAVSDSLYNNLKISLKCTIFMAVSILISCLLINLIANLMTIDCHIALCCSKEKVSLSIFNFFCSLPVDVDDQELMRKIIKSSVGTKFINKWYDFWGYTARNVHLATSLLRELAVNAFSASRYVDAGITWLN